MISSIVAEFRRYKALGEAAIAQVSEADLTRAPEDFDVVVRLVT